MPLVRFAPSWHSFMTTRNSRIIFYDHRHNIPLFQGLTKSLIESPPTANGLQTTEREMATSVGYVLGFLIGGFLLSRFSRNFIMLVTLQVLGSMLVTVPWISSDWATDTVYIIIGVSLAILMIGNVCNFNFNSA